jgi:hypothetical protein
MRRRTFIALLGGATAVWPLAARAEQAPMPVIGYIGFGSLDSSGLYLAAFRKGPGDTGFVDGQNVSIEYRWLEGHYYRMIEQPTKFETPVVSSRARGHGRSRQPASAASACGRSSPWVSEIAPMVCILRTRAASNPDCETAFVC